MTHSTDLSWSIRPRKKRQPGLLRAALRYLRFQKDYRHVKRLPAYLLEDIGLSHDQIDAAERANRRLR
ncbi:MAG: DUF1127 domain-containing protein [Pseudomonadota bacterium]